MKANELLTYDLAIDFEELKSQKRELIKLMAENNILDDGINPLNGLLNLLDAIGDIATDVHGLSPNLVFHLEDEIC